MSVRPKNIDIGRNNTRFVGDLRALREFSAKIGLVGDSFLPPEIPKLTSMTVLPKVPLFLLDDFRRATVRAFVESSTIAKMPEKPTLSLAQQAAHNSKEFNPPLLPMIERGPKGLIVHMPKGYPLGERLFHVRSYHSSSRGIELFFAAYVQQFLDGDLSKLTDNIIFGDTKLTILQPNEPSIITDMSSLIARYTNLSRFPDIYIDHLKSEVARILSMDLPPAPDVVGTGVAASRKKVVLPRIVEKGGEIHIHMPSGKVVGRFKNGRIIEPDQEGLELVFAALIKHYLDGDVDVFTSDIDKRIPRPIHVVQGGPPPIGTKERNRKRPRMLVVAYARLRKDLMDETFQPTIKTIIAIRKAAKAILEKIAGTKQQPSLPL